MYIIRMSMNAAPHSAEPIRDKKKALEVFNSRVIEGLDYPQKLSISLVEVVTNKILAQFIIREDLNQ